MNIVSTIMAAISRRFGRTTESTPVAHSQQPPGHSAVVSPTGAGAPTRSAAGSNPPGASSCELPGALERQATAPSTGYRPVSRQRPPGHLLEAASRLEQERLASSRDQQPAPVKETAPTAAAQIDDKEVVPASEVLVRRSPGRVLHMVVRDANDKLVHVSWHNDNETPIVWRVASDNVADSIRRIFVSAAFPGCSFSISKQLLDALPQEVQMMIGDAIASGIIKRADDKRWRYDGIVILLAECGTQCQPLASFDCAGEPEQSRRQRWQSLTQLSPAS